MTLKRGIEREADLEPVDPSQAKRTDPEILADYADAQLPASASAATDADLEPAAPDEDSYPR